jgi:hypothetical protein
LVCATPTSRMPPVSSPPVGSPTRPARCSHTHSHVSRPRCPPCRTRKDAPGRGMSHLPLARAAPVPPQRPAAS